MRITDITPENEHHYFCCLEEWSDEMKEAGDSKQKWYRQMKEKGVRVKYALDENDVIGGMIHYLPVEYSMFEGKNLYVVLCIWVHGYKQGRGNYRKRGMGKALLKAAEEDCKQLGANGLVAWGLAIPVFMKASWFRKQGYKVVARDGMMRLLWRPFNEKALPPKFMKRKKKPVKNEDKTEVVMFRNGWCQAYNISYERSKRALKEFDGKTSLVEYDTTDREVVKEWGITDGLFINGKELWIGPPPSYEKIKKEIDKSVKKIK